MLQKKKNEGVKKVAVCMVLIVYYETISSLDSSEKVPSSFIESISQRLNKISTNDHIDQRCLVKLLNHAKSQNLSNKEAILISIIRTVLSNNMIHVNISLPSKNVYLLNLKRDTHK